ncbi:Gamma-glutamylputrescine synthetase PuuA [Hafnia alvei]|nr:Gamma-glutamylputrescine synthetase PuuA [Hafnia alvei]
MQTNIVEVENFVQHSEERRSSAFQREVKITWNAIPPRSTSMYSLPTLMVASVESVFLLLG